MNWHEISLTNFVCHSPHPKSNSEFHLVHTVLTFCLLQNDGNWPTQKPKVVDTLNNASKSNPEVHNLEILNSKI